ncbi:MAG: hypothetical protein WBD31_00990 [Rubripirellula sp.]
MHRSTASRVYKWKTNSPYPVTAAVRGQNMYRYSLTIAFVVSLATQLQAVHCDAIDVDGEHKFIREFPLHGFMFPRHVRIDDPGFHSRRYQCSWELRKSRLYLKSFDAKSGGQFIDPKTIFGEDLPVLATWHTGKITILNKPVDPLKWEPSHVAADVCLVDRGKVLQQHSISRLRLTRPSNLTGFTLKRIDGKLVAQPQSGFRHDGWVGYGHRTRQIVGGDFIHGILDPNGISMTFDGSSDALANAVLAGEKGNSFTVVRSTPEKPDRIEAVVVDRQ